MKARKNKKKASVTATPIPPADGRPPPAPFTASETGPLTALDVWLMIGLTLLALALRIWRVGVPNFWGDEIHTFLKSSQPLAVILRGESIAEGQFPPLHYILAHFSMRLFGFNEWGSRLPTVMVGVLAIPVQYLLGRFLVGRRLAVLSTAVLTLSLYHIYYSRDNHSYGIYYGLAAISFYCFLRLLFHERQHWGYWAGYAVSTSLMMLTHFIGAVACITQAVIGGVYFLEMGLRRGHWKAAGRMIFWFALAGGVVAAAMAPFFSHLLGVTNYVAGEVDTIHFDAKFLNFTFSYQGFGNGWGLALYLFVLILGTVYALIHRRNTALLLLGWFLFPYLF